MECTQARPAIGPLHDGELTGPSSDALRQHLAQCPACTALSAQHVQLSFALRDGASYFAAPPSLKVRVADAAARAAVPWIKRTFQLERWAFMTTLAATAALAVVLTLTITPLPHTDALSREVTANHVRSLMVDHLADVATSDQHTVKPWFAGKLDFSPPVLDLSRDGFELIGGRLDYLGTRTVAALVYQRRGHLINVFVWPTANAIHSARADHGYNSIAWGQSGLQMWAVSDLNAAELDELHRLLQNNAS